MKRSELFFSALLLPVDIVALLLAFGLAYSVRDAGILVTPELSGDLGRIVSYGTHGTILPFASYLRYVSYIIPVMIAVFALTGLYAMRGAMPWTKRLARVFIGVTAGLFVILLLFLLKNDFFLPRSTVLYAWAFSIVLVLTGRTLVRGTQLFLGKYSIGVIRVAVIGHTDTARQIIQDLNHHPHSLYRLVKTIDSAEVSKIIDAIHPDSTDEVIVASEQIRLEDQVAVRNYCLENQLGYSFVPPLFTVLQSSYAIRSEVGVPMIEVRPTPLEGWGRVGKRVFDIVASLVLITLLSPFIVIVAILIKATSPGPLIYRHERIGKDQKAIKIWKFRSIRIEYCTGNGYDGNEAFQALLKSRPDLAKEWEETTKLKNDPRVSSIGRIIRKTSLDELPQLFNVLFGTLSLVGPRPIVQEEVRKYGKTARILFTVKPGVTGLWQVSGRNDISFKERVALDTDYIEHWNIWWDLWIVLKTARVFLPSRERGAY